MTRSVLNPCPTCGKRFDFPLTGCMTFVGDFLLASSGGKCPDCGTQVAVDAEHVERELPVDSLSAAQTVEEIEAVKIVDLALSVRCRATLVRMGIQTVGELLQLTNSDLSQRLAQDPSCLDDIDCIMADKGLKLRECENDLE